MASSLSGVERLPIPVINAVDQATLEGFFEEYITTAETYHPAKAATYAPAVCCQGPLTTSAAAALSGGVCGCAANHAPTHSFWAELVLFSRGRGLVAYPDQQEIEAELEAEIIRTQKGKGCCKVSVVLRLHEGTGGSTGWQRESLLIRLSIECCLQQSAVDTVLRGFLSSPVIDKNCELEEGELRELSNNEVLLNKLPRKKSLPAYYNEDGLLYREADSPIYECCGGCSCSSKGCQNRVVQLGSHVALNVIRTRDKGTHKLAHDTIYAHLARAIFLFV
eukprot:SAG31_NODE_2339_length_5920_cov_15.209414_4_plen_278_part_00